jgi:collagenase-like PrtC family protease
MRLSVAYNGDLDLIERLKEIKSVVNLFGSMSKTVTGGGRSSFVLAQISKNDIEQAVTAAHSYGIEFNYVMNSICTGNKEYTQAIYAEIVAHFDWLRSIGVDWVTLANPYIIELCKRKFPDIKVSLSTFVSVETIQRAKFYEAIGVDEITVRENINRKFALLQALKQSVKCDIQLLANQACLYQCPFQHYHCNFVSHASQSGDASSEGLIDFCILRCNQYRFSQPAELIKPGWIRPEDLRVYEELGIDKFKLSDRGSPTAWLVKVARAYHQRKYEGNLAEILNLCMGMNRRRGQSRLRADASPLTPEITAMRKLLKAFALLEVEIDNQGLNGFLEYFKIADCNLLACDSCGYCQKVAEQVVRFPDPQSVARGLEYLAGLAEAMVDRVGQHHNSIKKEMVL